jgi:glycosyltransferase involved in cell wall biosynthesis
MSVTVIRQANSGGPSGPRNVGLGKARGRYVFFLDADDYFGPEALERMVAMGDAQGTDVVLGKVVGVNRTAPK